MLGFATMASLLDAITKGLTATYPVPVLLWLRFLGQTGSLLLLLPWLGWRGLVVTSAPRVQLGRGVALAISAGSFVFALSYLPFATAKVLSFTSPLLVTLLSLPLLGERVGWRRAVAVLAGFLGVVVVIRPGVGAPDVAGLDWAMLLPLLSALAYACYQLLTRHIAQRDGAVTSLFYVSVVGLAGASVLVPFHWAAVPPWLVAFLLVHGALVGAGHFLQIRALALAPASLLAPFGYASLLWAVLIGALVFGEAIGPFTLLGALAIAGSGLYLFRSAAAGR
jgi:drug/metabolite transporter (DMT)-like permease